jgi:serine/threonine protein kinase
MQANPANHLSPDILGALAAGRLPAAAAADVLAHLHGCAECRQAATALLGDSFLLRLGAAGPPPGTVAEALAPADTAGPGPSPGQAPTVPHAAPAVLPELREHPQYEVLRELGRGGMGVVYLAKNKLMDRPEVLKVVNRQLLGQAGAAERFLREIRSAAKLSHPHIVTAYAALQAGELLVFAMEYVEGETLEEFVQARGRLPLVNACYYAQQVALGLQHACEKGMVHRDIKPQNLILAREGKKHVVKVLDFGLAKATREGEEADRGLTGTGWMLGTPDYMAPEQTLDAARADIRADVYSLGCTLYYLLTGSPPFTGKSQFELLQAHQSKEATPLDRLRPEVPADLAAVVAKMMAKDPARRYQKPAEVVQALAPFAKAGLKPLPPRPAPVVPVATVIENNPANAPATEQTAGGPARESASLVNRPAGAPEAGWSLIADPTTAPKAPVADSPPAKPKAGSSRPMAPIIQGTVIEGSATIARAMRKAPEKGTTPSRKRQSREAEEEEAGPANKASKGRGPIGLAVGGAVLCLLCGSIIFILRRDGPGQPGDAGSTEKIDKPIEANSKKLTRDNFGKLKVGMTQKQLEDILGGGNMALGQEVDAAFFGTAVDEKARAVWSIAVKEGKVCIWKGAKDNGGDTILLAGFGGDPRAGSKVDALCYIYYGPDYRRASQQIGSLLKVTQENFAKLTLGMTLGQMQETLGMGRRATSGDLPSAPSTSTAWINAAKADRVQVWQEGADRILAAFPGTPSAASKVEVLFNSRDGSQTPADKWLVSKENFAKLKVGMTLDQVQETLGMGRQATIWDLSGRRFDAPATGGLDEKARKAYWNKAVKEKSVYGWISKSGGTYPIILAGFSEAPSAGTKVEALYYGDDRGTEHKGPVYRAGLAIEFDPGTLRGYRNQTGKSFYFQVTGSTTGFVWGTGVYSDDSNLPTAAVHAGVLQAGQKGVVKVSILPGQNAYQGSTRNGVTSANYGNWIGSFRVSAVRGVEHKGPVYRAGLAIEFDTMPKSYAVKWGLPSKSQVQIGLVHAGGGGAKMGLKRDDVVLRINSRDVLTPKQARVALRGLKTGAPVEFVVMRYRLWLVLSGHAAKTGAPVEFVVKSGGKQLKLTGRYATEFPESEEMRRLVALAANDPRVQTILGYRYWEGIGGVSNHAEAVKWYRKAADAGNACGQNGLGYYYERGLGLPKNEQEAFKWYRKAAEQDFAEAQNNMGRAYVLGLGVAKDLKEAVKWYQKAAEQDYEYAQANFGSMYENGHGVSKNRAEAVKWYKKAAVRDNQFAKDRLRALGY